RQAIAWYNARHDVRELLPKERNGYARAHWRDEGTPSVRHLDGNAWVDYGNSPYARSGKKDGGDAFEALCRVSGKARREALRDLVLPELLREAGVLLAAAARAGVGPPGWVAAITSPRGWRWYDEERASAGARSVRP
ncbi:MAG: hypothetical protein M3Q65_09760, partial [Chloroflexota bacterium]|nr:hypothetical protein [Chloroflexota bacterium]